MPPASVNRKVNKNSLMEEIIRVSMLSFKNDSILNTSGDLLGSMFLNILKNSALNLSSSLLNDINIIKSIIDIPNATKIKVNLFAKVLISKKRTTPM